MKWRDLTAGPIADLIGLAGAGLLSYGAWMAWPPAGFLTAGVAGIAISGLLASRQ